MSSLRAAAGDLHDDLVRLRRDLHREPEVGLDLPRTQEKVLAALDGLPLETTTGTALSSVTAVLRGSSPGPVVLLRGDMDALPLTERSGVPYASEIPGTMHACGHDLHTAMLVGAARLLAERSFAGSVVFMFQPGEEGNGGAKLMIEEGLLEAAGARPVAAYGLHVTSSLIPAGIFLTRRGPLMAAADQMRVTVRGAGGHGSQPHLAKDPIPAASAIVTALQTLATRRFDAFDPVVITVGSFNAGTAPNIIPDEAQLGLTIRSFSPAARARVIDGVRELVDGIAAAHGLTAELEHEMGYPVTVNDAAEAEFAAGAVADLYGPERFIWVPNPMTTAEDFSYVLEEVPGAFVFLGACPPDRDPATAPFNHATTAVFDDAVLPDGSALLAELALRRLAA
ncbi:M20 metallopeptidase family protein [Actinoallomurus iriomotensis]|uniref:Amidohydrolase n=1 Tax=Actinoallomurus iriomotensis TaxID=478107 RepID=A0A9W6VSB6_9ACTN|nr:M20 family metallopeptidase [Actinoallomurus iriomotensis]GLY77347.1 amidohydrolase [Actinoallomurus iriomotensis]